jgi:hypothetical protein
LVSRQKSFVNAANTNRGPPSVYQTERREGSVEKSTMTRQDSTRKKVSLDQQEVNSQIDEFENRFVDKKAKRPFKYPSMELKKIFTDAQLKRGF